MSPQDAHRIGPQEALQAYLEDLLFEAPAPAQQPRPDEAAERARPEPAVASAPVSRPEPASTPVTAPQAEAAPAHPQPMAHQPQVLEPRPLVLPTIKLTDIKRVETPVDEEAAPISRALAEPAPAPAPVVEVVNEPQPVAVSLAVDVTVSMASSAQDPHQEAAAPVAERAPFPESQPLEPVAEQPGQLAAPAASALTEGLQATLRDALLQVQPEPQVQASAPEPEPVAASAAPGPAPSRAQPGPVEPQPAPARPAVERREPVAEPAALLMPQVLKVADPVPEVAEPVQAPPQVQPEPPAAVPPLPPKVISGRPQWGESRFECLLFDVAGLTLAVPLVCLGTIHSLEGQTLTPLFGQPDWFLGMLKTHSGNIKVIDTARWVMPERYRDEFRDDLAFVITIQGFDWGLAVHKVDRSIHLHPDQVKWRSLRTQRPWLAGTVIEHMCALLDVAALAELIESGALKKTR